MYFFNIHYCPKRGQRCVKYRGIIISIKRNTIVNTGDLKILHNFFANRVDFPDIIYNFSKIVCVLPSFSGMNQCSFG